MVHSRFCIYSQTIAQPSKEISEVEMDRETRESIQEAEEEIHKRTGIGSTRFRQKIRIEVDALDYTTGGVLSMEWKDGK